ncbi:MAG: hypothetical protein NT154_02885, partial [Verrucomicrobia bacterium]|nr:hypothetical protein [Verrucomicrobiota bacterium]
MRRKSMRKNNLSTQTPLSGVLTCSATRFTLQARPRSNPVVAAGCAAFLRITFIILLSGLAFCGCSKKAASKGSAIDRVQAGQEVAWADGYVLTVAKREGSSLEGVRIVNTLPDGQTRTIFAEKGTISPGDDANSVKIALYEAQTQTGNNQMS